jgi:hypothetical protein
MPQLKTPILFGALPARFLRKRDNIAALRHLAGPLTGDDHGIIHLIRALSDYHSKRSHFVTAEPARRKVAAAP